MTAATRAAPAPVRRHVAALHEALDGLEADADRLVRWGSELADRLAAGARLLTAGNGGSAAHAAHLAGELVGRYREDRRPLAAIALTAEPGAITAIANDWSFEQVFARQVGAFGRPGDVLLVLSTSGRSPNVLAAVEAARRLGVESWALTGAAPNPAQQAADDAFVVASSVTATVQEVHQVAIHLVCEAVDARLASTMPTGSPVSAAGERR